MTYEEFLEFVPSKCMHETIYEDGEGRLILVIEMLDAYSMIEKVNVEPCCNDFDNCHKVCMPRAKFAERERCAELRNQLHFYHFDKTSSVSKAELVACVEQGLDDYAKLIRTGNV
jgi:hypothetical protein